MRIRTLSKEELQWRVPSAFAKEASPNVSDKYLFVSTEQVIDSMIDLGWKPVAAAQQQVRVYDKSLYTKHLIQFESPMTNEIAMKGYEVGALRPRIGITNSHDRSSQFSMMAMILRTICSNQATVTEQMFGDLHFKHVLSMTEVAAGVYEYVKNLPPLTDKIEHYLSIHMTAASRKDFAQQALMLRYESEEKAPIKYSDLLTVRREMDNIDSLWNVYNVVQENLIHPEAASRFTGKKVRNIFGMNSDLKINAELWNLMIAFSQRLK